MKPNARPARPDFSSGPCAKRPGWTPEALGDAAVGRSHRSKTGKKKIVEAVDRTRSLLGIPNALLVWLAVGLATMFLLHRTTLGRAIYGVGNRERAAYLSGIATRRVVVLCFTLAGACSAMAGVLLTGYSTKAYQAMGDAYLLPAIAAVVLGGTHILGGRGSYLGTVVGAMLITLLQSILSVMQIPEMGRQVTYGVVIVAMLLVYGRGRRLSD